MTYLMFLYKLGDWKRHDGGRVARIVRKWQRNLINWFLIKLTIVKIEYVIFPNGKVVEW